MLRFEKRLKDKLDDDIKFGGLEALVLEELEKHLKFESLVLEELEKHLILNSDRLRTFEDARLEVVTCVEAKFGFGIRDSKPSDTGAREHSDPMNVDAINSLSRLAKEQGHRVRVMGVLSAVEHNINETAMHAKVQASNRLAKANRASHAPTRARAKGRVKKTKENTKENLKEPEVRKVHTGTERRKLVSLRS